MVKQKFNGIKKSMKCMFLQKFNPFGVKP